MIPMIASISPNLMAQSFSVHMLKAAIPLNKNSIDTMIPRFENASFVSKPYSDNSVGWPDSRIKNIMGMNAPKTIKIQMNILIQTGINCLLPF